MPRGKQNKHMDRRLEQPRPRPCPLLLLDGSMDEWMGMMMYFYVSIPNLFRASTSPPSVLTQTRQGMERCRWRWRWSGCEGIQGSVLQPPPKDTHLHSVSYACGARVGEHQQRHQQQQQQ